MRRCQQRIILLLLLSDNLTELTTPFSWVSLFDGRMISTCLNPSPCDFVHALMQILFLSVKFHVCLKKTAQLPSFSHHGASGLDPVVNYKKKVGPSLALCHKSFCNANQSGAVWPYFSNILYKKKLTGDDTPYTNSLSPFSLIFLSEVTFSCLGVIQCFGDHHSILSFLRFASSIFHMLQGTLNPKFAISFLMIRIRKWMSIITIFFSTITVWKRSMLAGFSLS